MHLLFDVLRSAVGMTWDLFWPLAFGLMLSSVTRAFISTKDISHRLGSNSATSLTLASFLGAISSSCSYAAASMGRTLLAKGGTWANVVAYMVASTNLVFEMFVVILALLGWAFVAGEVIGGILFIVVAAGLTIRMARYFPDGIRNDSEVGAEIEGVSCCGPSKTPCVTVPLEPSFVKRLREAAGYFYMDVMMIGKDILIGIVLGSLLMVIVPASLWRHVFLSGYGHSPHLIVVVWNAVAGMAIAVLAFLCSVGNVVLAAALWHCGISFGGVLAFILSDLITIPMLLVYRQYYGMRTMWRLALIFAMSIFVTSVVLDYSFTYLHLIPLSAAGKSFPAEASFKWNYHAWLNIFFGVAAIGIFYWGRKEMKGNE